MFEASAPGRRIHGPMYAGLMSNRPNGFEGLATAITIR